VFVDRKPETGKCHVIDAELSLKNLPLTADPRSSPGDDDDLQKGRFRIAIGSQGKFSIYFKLPTGYEVSVGQNDHPWMATGAKEVIEGTENPVSPLKGIRDILGPKRTALLRMLGGVLNSVAMVPDVLERHVVVQDGGIKDGLRILHLSARDHIPITARLSLNPNGNTPKRLSFSAPTMQGEIKFIEWRMNSSAEASLFQPPANIPRRQVDQDFLYTLFSTSLNFFVGSAE
jgi:hypothetical protein